MNNPATKWEKRLDEASTAGEYARSLDAKDLVSTSIAERLQSRGFHATVAEIDAYLHRDQEPMICATFTGTVGEDAPPATDATEDGEYVVGEGWFWGRVPREPAPTEREAADDDWREVDDLTDLAEAKDALRRRDEQAARRRELKVAASRALFMDEVRALTPTIAALPYVAPTPSPDLPERAAVVVLSDCHWCKETPSFNSDVARRRLLEYRDAILDRVALERHAATIDECHLLLTGDLVDGSLIFATQSFHGNTPLVKQVYEEAGPAIAAFIRDLAAFFRVVHIATVPGNHGRFSKQHAEVDNADNMLYHALEATTSPLANVHWTLNREEVHIHPVWETNILLFHGHQVGGGAKPYNGVLGKVANWATALRNEATIHVTVNGHFHTPAALTFNDIDVIMSGTFSTDDDYARNKIAAKTPPIQTLMFVERGRPGLAGRHPITLS